MKNWRAFSSTRYQMEVQSTCGNSLQKIVGATSQRLQESKQCIHFMETNELRMMFSQLRLVEQTLNAGPLTPVSSDINNLEIMTPITSCLATRTFVYPIYHAERSLLISENSFDITSLLESHRGHIPKAVSAKFEQSKRMEIQI